MSKLTVGGTVIEGVFEAHCQILHSNPKSPDPIPIMQWDLKLRNQFDDVLPKWAMAKQGDDRFKKCELVINHANNQKAHTYTLLSGYVASYDEIEFPGSLDANNHEGGYYLHLVIRGHQSEAKDYTGENVMTVAKGEERKFPS